MSESAFQVIKSIGIPSIVKGSDQTEFTPETLHAASINKISLFYLKTLSKHGKLDSKNAELAAAKHKQQKLLELSSFLSKLFDTNAVSYAVMKTLRPFPYAGADVDVIVETQKGFSKAVELLLKENFTLLGHDLFSATLYRGDFDLNVDLQLEISVSGLPYLDKTLLLSKTKKILVNGATVKSLDTCAEVVVIACHCFYKEHMYTLADFYTAVLSITDENCLETCNLAKKTHGEAPLSALLSWVKKVVEETLEIDLSFIDKALNILDNRTFARVFDKCPLDFPQKFPQSLVALTLAHKMLVDRNARSSITRAVYSSLSQEQLRALMHHFRRESY